MSLETFNTNTQSEFGTPQLDVLIATAPVPSLPDSHAVYRCLSRAITQQAVQLKAVHLLAQLSRIPSNREPCFRCLMSVGGTLEHLLLKGDPANEPGIHVDVLCLLANVGEYKLDASQVLELYNGDVGMSVRALCALLSDTHSKHPLSSIMAASATTSSILSWQDAADQMSAAVRCMYELSTWKHFKNSLRAQSETDIPMVKLQNDFVRHIVAINQIITQPFKASAATVDSSLLSDGGSSGDLSFFPLLTMVFEDWLDLANCLPQNSEAESEKVRGLLASLEAALTNTVLLIINMLSFTNEFSAKFRSHVVIKSGGFVEKVLIPMLMLELDVLEGKRKSINATTTASSAARPAVVLQLLLKVIALLGFKTKIFRAALRQTQYLGARLIQNPVMMDSNCKIEFFALVVRLLINTDLKDSVQHILQAHAQLTPKQKLFLALRLANPAEKLYPIDVFCETYQSLRALFYIDPVAAAAVNDGPTVNNSAAPKFNFATAVSTSRTDAPEVFSGTTANRSKQIATKRVKRRGGGTSTSEKLALRRDAQRRRKNIVSKKQYQMKQAAKKNGNVDDDEVWEDLGDDEASEGDESTTFQRNTQRKVGGGDEDEGEELEDFSGVREAVVVAVGGAGAAGVSLFDEEEDADEEGDSSPSASITSNHDDATNALYAARLAQQAQQRGDVITSSTADVVRLTGGSPNTSKPKEQQEGDAPTTTTTFVVSGQTGPYDLSSLRTVAPPLGCPDQYLCALTRRIMTIPVISPTGDIFDKESILAFIKDPSHKNKHPFTGEGLYGRDLVVDVQLRRELDIVRCNYSY